MPLALQQLCVLCQRSCTSSRVALQLPARQLLTSRRQYARQASPRTVAQARKSALLQELSKGREEVQQDARDSQIPIVDNLEWSSPLDIVRYPDPRLRATNARIGVFDDSVKQLASEMFEIMYRDDGVGLAAPQVGVNVRMMVYNQEGKRGEGQEYILVNPKIISASRSTDVMEEGCLSFQDISKDLHIRGEVTRPKTIKIKAYNEKGAKVSLTITDEYLARIFQHEYDHLEGTLFHDRMNAKELDKCKPELIYMEKVFQQHHPGVQFQSVQ